MAYAALVSLAQTVDQILNHDRYSISLDEKQQIIYVHKYVILLQAFLEDFPEKADSLEGRIRAVANEAEDTIEYLMWERDYSHRAQLGYHFHELEKVTEKVESIAEQVMNIKNSFRIEEEQQLGDSPAATSSSRLAPTHKDIMVGFDEDLTEIKGRLCGESSKLQVIPIYGMGGIGKTTLARNAYYDPLIMEYFHIRAWITVSQDYSAYEILLGILASMKVPNEETFGQSSTELMAEKVYKSLKGMRYLIVMDDMWSTKVWDDLKMLFPDDHNGSRIMLTTRLSDVAAYPDPFSPLYEMHLMDADLSWDLLREKVFTDDDCPPELENIGMEIAKNCRGLPLAIVVIAGLLSTVSKTPASWKKIAENVNSAVAAKDGHLEKMISLSYTHLPHHLRPCFLYMGGFPEDYEIRVSKLVKLWVAEGFLKHKDESKSLEEEAEEYVEDLVMRSLIFVSKRKSNGKIKSCSVHDLVRDLCIRKAQQEKFLLHAEKILPESVKNQRRLSVTHFDRDCLANLDDSRIRTIKCFQCRGIAAGSLGNCKLLRVLVAVYTRFGSPRSEGIPFSEVSKLFHLTYLDLFDGNHLPEVRSNLQNLLLPEAISNLQNLQTLVIHARKTYRDYPSFKTLLPSGIWMMPQLRHLVSSFFGPLPSPEKETFSLENLQTLSLATNFRCTKRILKMIPNLKKLGIFYHRDNRDEYNGDYHLEDLVYLHQLEKLKIKIYADFPFRQKLNPAFPTSLKKLTLSGLRLPWEGIMIVGSLPNLQVLKLRDFACKGSTWETNEAEFPKLQFLLIDKSDLQHWITESSHFPRLKSLLLHRCWCLREIPDGIADIPTLELIEVENGNNSLVESAKRIQEEQQSWGNDALQVRCMTH